MTTPGNDILAVQRAYELARGFCSSRFTLGERLIAASLDLLETLASAADETNRTALLVHASRQATCPTLGNRVVLRCYGTTTCRSCV